MNWYAAVVRAHPRPVTVLVLAVTLAAAVGLGRLDFDERPRDYISHDPAERALLAELFRDFGADDTDLLAAVTGLVPDDPSSVRAIGDLVARLRATAGVVSVSSPLDARRVGRPLVPLFPRSPENFTPERLAAAFAAARAHPALAGQLISADGELFLIAIRLEEVAGTVAATARQVEALRGIVAEATRGTPLRVELAGHPVLRVDVMRAVRREFFRSILLAAVVTCGVAVLSFRSVPGVIAALAGPAVGLVWTLGWMGWTGQRINGLCTILPSLVFVLAFSDSAHLLVACQAARGRGLALRDAVAEAIGEVGPACVLMVLTTAVGFGALGVARIPGVRQFGIAGAVGTVLGLVAVLTVLPAVACLVGRRGEPEASREASGRTAKPVPAGAVAEVGRAAGPGDAGRPAIDAAAGRAAGRLLRAVLARPRTTVAAAVLATAGLLAVSLRLTADVRWLEMLPPDDPTCVVTRRCDDALGGALVASVIVEWPPEFGLESPQVLAMLGQVGRELEAGGLLANSFSVASLLAAFAADGAADAAAFRHLARVPERQRGRLLREDLRRAVVTARVPDVGAARLLPEFERVSAGLAALEAEHAGFRLRLTGSAVTAARAVYQIIADTRASLATSALVILAMTAIAFRSLRYGLVCVLPNLFPLLATAAALVAVGEPLRLASAVTFSIALGLADDSAIHFVSGFLRARRRGLATPDALAEVLGTGGRAMVISAVTLAAGMAPLLASRLPPLRTFAALSIFAIAATLVADFLILPAVLAQVEKGQGGLLPRTVRRTAAPRPRP